MWYTKRRLPKITAFENVIYEEYAVTREENIVEEEKVLYIAEIPYETGEIHFRYSRRLSEDKTKWIREGLFTEYYQNGNIASTGLYDDGLENGHWIDYHENGQIAAEGDYVNGKESGKWSYYDENGILEEEEIYE